MTDRITDDHAYASLGAFGQHVLGAAGGYMGWMCEVLTLPDPGIHSAPDAAAMVRNADDYMEHVLERWRGPAARNFSAGKIRKRTARQRQDDACRAAIASRSAQHFIYAMLPEHHQLNYRRQTGSARARNHSYRS